MTKIPFNIPPFIGTELEYVKQALEKTAEQLLEIARNVTQPRRLFHQLIRGWSHILLRQTRLFLVFHK
jgi:hypothetical protein